MSKTTYHHFPFRVKPMKPLEKVLIDEEAFHTH